MSQTLSPSVIDVTVLPPEKRAGYLTQVEQRLGLRLPSDYVDRGLVIAAYKENQELFGGMLLVTQGPFRSLESIEHILPESRSRFSDQSRIGEVNGLWVVPNAMSPVAAISFWSQVIDLMLQQPLDQFLFTHDSDNDRMKSIMRWLNPETVYSGPTAKLPGMTQSGDETIALVNRASLKTFQQLLVGYDRLKSAGPELSDLRAD